MALVNIRVYNTQTSEWEIDKNVDVQTWDDVKNVVNPRSGESYTDRSTRDSGAAFAKLNQPVTVDKIELFKTASTSKAG